MVTVGPETSRICVAKRRGSWQAARKRGRRREGRENLNGVGHRGDLKIMFLPQEFAPPQWGRVVVLLCHRMSVDLELIVLSWIDVFSYLHGCNGQGRGHQTAEFWSTWSRRTDGLYHRKPKEPHCSRKLQNPT